MKQASYNKIKTFNSSFEVPDETPVYPISVAAKLLNIHPRTIIKYEIEGLIKPSRNATNNHRMFSKADLQWIKCIRDIVHKEGINMKSIKYMLTRIPCWGLKKCSLKIREKCSAFRHFTKPCWEVLNNICKMDSKTACEECSVFKLANQNQAMVKLNMPGTL